MKAARPGFTLAELLVTMVVSLILLGGAVNLFLIFNRSVEQQNTARDVQTQVHSTVEQLVRLVRNADRVELTSSATELQVTGGMTSAMCGASTCRLHVDAERGLVMSAVGSAEERVVARSVTALEFGYAIDDDGDGTISCPTGPASCFASSPGPDADDVLGVRMRLSFLTAEARGRFSGDVTVHAALRARILDRHTLADG